MNGQFDLFGQDEAEEAARLKRARYWRTPQTCPFCGATEPTGMLLDNNHGTTYGTNPYVDHCTAMFLTANHVAYAANQPDPDHLKRDLARAREVWANRVDDLRQLLAGRGLDLDELDRRAAGS